VSELFVRREQPSRSAGFRFNANIRFMARDMVDDSTIDKLPLVAVGYGPVAFR